MKCLILMLALVGCDERIEQLEKNRPSLRCHESNTPGVALCKDVVTSARSLCYLPSDKYGDAYCIPETPPACPVCTLSCPACPACPVTESFRVDPPTEIGTYYHIGK